VVVGPPGAPISIHGRMSVKAEAGHHLAPRQLSSGRNVFEELSDGFTLIALDADESSLGALQAAASDRKVPLKVVRDTFAAGREAYQSRLVLVRPDQYVVWAADSAPPDARALMELVAGQ
jgi:4-hydroxyisophthalate hydroxylase